VTFAKGQLVAVTGIDPNVIRRIARVVEDRGSALVLVETDDEIEGEAAIEYDFATPDPDIFEIARERLRPILE
jgi:hypothetical protein